MAKNLYNLTAVTTVNDSDLLHVNQGGVSSDKKVTKANLLKEVNSSISSINNSLTNSSVSGTNAVTLASGFSTAVVSDCVLYRNNKTVVAYLEIGSLSLAAGQNILGTVPSGYRPAAWTSNVGTIGSGSEKGTDVRVVLNPSGQLIVYAQSAIASTLRITITYITN